MLTSSRARATLCLILLSLMALVGVLISRGTTRNLLHDLAVAAGSDLNIAPRLSGGFRPGAAARKRGTAAPAIPDLSPDVRIAIARLEKDAAASDDATTRAALGVAYLVRGDVDASIAVLEDVVSLREDAQALSDLSAAYLVKAERIPVRRIEYLARALDTAARSLRARPSNEARFNKALAVEGLSPYVGEPRPWADYVTAETDPDWRSVARTRAEQVTVPADARNKWDERRRVLRAKLAARDGGFVEQTVATFPEASLEFLEQELLVEWAHAELAGDGPGAARALADAQSLADTVARVTRDVMPATEVALIATSTKGAQTARLRALAYAHVAYAQGLARYDADDYTSADAFFAEALSGFAAASSPYAEWAAAQQATIAFQRRALDAADRQLAAVERAARARTYRTLLGRTLWLRGLVYSKQWRLPEALDAFREAASCFEDAGEREYAVSLYSVLADNLRTLGEYHQSWEYIGKTLEGMWRVRRPTRRYLFVYTASLFASSQGLVEGALIFQDAALREAQSGVNIFIVAEALIERAAIRVRGHDPAGAARDTQAALDRIRDIPAGPMKQYAQAEVELVRADLDRGHQDDARIDGIRSAIDFFSAAEPAVVPRLFLGLAKAHLDDGDAAAAETAFARGIEQLERRQAGLGDDALKMSYFDEGWNVFPEMIAFQLRRHDVTQAFAYAERSRARLLLASAVGTEARPRALHEIQQQLPRSTVMLYYATLADRVLVWRITSTDSELVERAIDRQELARLVSRHLSSMAESRHGVSSANEALFAAVMRPVLGRVRPGATLVIVPDGDLQRLPFATIRNPETGRYLVEDHALVVAPSASLFLASLTRLQTAASTAVSSALLVGDPRTDGGTTELAALPGADREATESAAFYERHEVLTGAAATRRQFIESAPRHDVVHFGGHALVNVEYPLLSRLLFAGSDGGVEPQPLFAHEISRLRFPRTRVVVLAACSTAVGAISRGEGVVSIARPFLAAGVPIVIASQWDVDDRATERLFVTFHRELSRTGDAAGALRTAQLSLLHDPDAVLASPASWGGFFALGTTDR